MSKANFTAADALTKIQRHAAHGSPHCVNQATIEHIISQVTPEANPPLPAPLKLADVVVMASLYMLKEGLYGESAEYAPLLAHAWLGLPEEAQRRLRAIVTKTLAWDTEQYTANKANHRIRYPEFTDLGSRATRRAWDLVQKAWEGHPLPKLPTPEAIQLEALMHALDSWQLDNVDKDEGYAPSTDSAMDFLTQLGQMGYSIVATSSLPEMPRPQQSNHIPCGQCGACHANEPCARLQQPTVKAKPLQNELCEQCRESPVAEGLAGNSGLCSSCYAQQYDE